jgi:hypothetical protein
MRCFIRESQPPTLNQLWWQEQMSIGEWWLPSTNKESTGSAGPDHPRVPSKNSRCWLETDDSHAPTKNELVRRDQTIKESHPKKHWINFGDWSRSQLQTDWSTQKQCRVNFGSTAKFNFGDRSRSGLETDLPTQRNPRQYQIWWQEQKSIGDWFAHQKKPTPKSNLVTGAEVYWRLICPPKTDTQINFGERSRSQLQTDLPAQKRRRIDFGDRSRSRLETDLPAQNNPPQFQLS